MCNTFGFRMTCLLAVSLLCVACKGGGGSDGATSAGPGGGSSPAAAELRVADTTSPYRDVLIECVLAATSAQSCTLQALPLIGQRHLNPSIDDILAQTVVSHPWMGTRFREVLALMPAEMLTLLRSVTAIVIANGIRPSNYSSGTGAIYIDPAYLWLDNVEKATIFKDEDYRAGFGDSLPLVSLWRYIEGDDYAWPYHDLNGSETRTLVDIDRRFAALMFHELAHANDIFPRSKIIFLDQTMSVWNAARAMRGQRISDQLANHSPLNSQLMIELTEVLYTGVEPTAAQLGLTAELVGLEFENDGANYDYAYTSPLEDLAMMFEEIMMHHHYGVDRQIAYTDAPVNDGQFCEDYIVRWGFRNRIGHVLVKSRAEFALQLLLDVPDVSVYTNALPTPGRMTTGTNWCDIQLSPAPPENLKLKQSQTQSTAGTPATPMRPDDLSVWH
jgi:hypothetical protein